MAIALGGGPTSRFWHPIVGVAFFVGVIWTHSLWSRDVALSDRDRTWLRQTEDYAANRDELLPPQDRFNAGQKAFYWVMFWGALALLATGLVMWFPELVPYNLRTLRSVFVLLHEVAALITIGAFIIHVYMGIFMVPGSLTAIIHGYVSRDWARTHHRLWYERLTGRPAPRG